MNASSIPRSAVTLGLLAAWTVHDLEEVATVARWTRTRVPVLRERHPRVPDRVWRSMEAVDGREFATAVGVMAVVVAAASADGHRTGGRSAFYQASLNGFGLHGLVHLAQAAATRGYTPGVVTSPLLVVPFTLWARGRPAPRRGPAAHPGARRGPGPGARRGGHRGLARRGPEDPPGHDRALGRLTGRADAPGGTTRPAPARPAGHPVVPPGGTGSLTRHGTADHRGAGRRGTGRRRGRCRLPPLRHHRALGHRGARRVEPDRGRGRRRGDRDHRPCPRVHRPGRRGRPRARPCRPRRPAPPQLGLASADVAADDGLPATPRTVGNPRRTRWVRVLTAPSPRQPPSRTTS